MIQKVLALLGYEVATSTIWKYVDRSGKEPSATWRAFLKNHASQIVAIDFFAVATTTFRILNGFVNFLWSLSSYSLIPDHVIVLGEAHQRRILSEYVAYYNATRPHGSLDGNSPIARQVHGPDQGKIVAIPVLAGIHYRYQRVAA